jgi:hypothetical protein
VRALLLGSGAPHDLGARVAFTSSVSKITQIYSGQAHHVLRTP